MAPMSASTPVANPRGDTRRSAGPAAQVAGSHAVGGRYHGGRMSAARQVRDQRKGYARAVLRGVARTYRGRPAAQVQKLLTQALGPLGVRLSPAALRDLAGHIEAGRPVELP
jgi:hypothetical protein